MKKLWRIINHRDIFVDYPTEQRDKTLFEIDYDYICRIAKAGMVVAIPKYEGGFGESVTYELAVAKYLGIPRAQYDPVKRERIWR